MKKAINIFGYILIVLAIISASGAAGDCDGHCMENANSILAMTIIPVSYTHLTLPTTD